MLNQIRFGHRVMGWKIEDQEHFHWEVTPYVQRWRTQSIEETSEQMLGVEPALTYTDGVRKWVITSGFVLDYSKPM